jgi:hypothetical protein
MMADGDDRQRIASQGLKPGFYMLGEMFCNDPCCARE